jgi:hypothetical protein
MGNMFDGAWERRTGVGVHDLWSWVAIETQIEMKWIGHHGK